MQSKGFSMRSERGQREKEKEGGTKSMKEKIHVSPGEQQFP